jgi:menaquinone-dependent protoporphyrinogen IX oxidase
MARFLLTYATTHGQTAKIAGALADSMRAAGGEVVVRDVIAVSEEDVAEADAFVLAGPLYRLIMRREGHPVDPQKDHEFTDWDAVARLGGELTGLVDAPGARER